MKKYDERETLFSRVFLDKDSEEYKAFYQLHPELQKRDDMVRKACFRDNYKASDTFKQLIMPVIKHNKYHIKSIHEMAENYPVNRERKIVPADFVNNIKEITKYYGATDVGVAKLTDYSYYDYFGGLSDELGIENYGEKIKKQYPYAIVFTVLMDKTLMNRGPHYEELLATEEGYLRVAHIGARLAMYIKDLGYKAQAVNSEFYLGPLVPLAYDAGLGQIGMTNHLVTKKYGNNVRLGAVYTTLELPVDKPIDFGLTEFCKKCALCLMNCPSNAIKHQPRMVNGRQFYQFDENNCFEMWTKCGTDCGTCIQSCPFTQGVDLELVEKMKDDPDLMDEIIQDHYRKYGRRPYTKKELDIVKLEKDKND